MASPPSARASASARAAVRFAKRSAAGWRSAKCCPARRAVSPAPTTSTCASPEVAEDLAREGHRRGGDGDGARRRSPSPSAARFPAAERRRDQPVEDAAQGALGGGEGEGVPHLAQDLGLPQDHRLETRGHAQQVARRLVVVPRVEVRTGGEEVAPPGATDERAQGALRPRPVGGHDVELRPVAGREHERFLEDFLPARGLQGLAHLVRAEGHVLALIEGGGAVARADQAEVRHQANQWKEGRKSRTAAMEATMRAKPKRETYIVRRPGHPWR